ncbi:methyltransferase, partial [Shigella sp. FC1967]|uniref:methyltransferase n=1 Tax=Shigella sp. FC1967 TaxID=1898041 RepID=UPI000AEE15E9
NVREDHDFQAGMSSLSKIENYFIIKNYEFPENKIVTDIAGGLGGLLLEVLKENPTLKGQLFEHEHVLERSKLVEENVREDHDFQAGMSSLSKIENYFIIKNYEFPEN